MPRFDELISEGLIRDAQKKYEDLWKFGNDDDWLCPLRKRKLGTETIEVSLKAHKDLMNVFNRISGMDKRSLSSKYLHFHAPDFFYIYDARAATAITKLRKGV